MKVLSGVLLSEDVGQYESMKVSLTMEKWGVCGESWAGVGKLW